MVGFSFGIIASNAALPPRIVIPKARHLRIEKTAAQAFDMSIGSLSLYNGPNHIAPVTGIVFPGAYKPTSDWHQLQDPWDLSIATSTISNRIYMEVDFGLGGVEYDKVRVAVPATHQLALNGFSLLVMDTNGDIMFQYLFTNITASSPLIFQFDMDGNLL
jgi:hypothetical protein